MTDFIIRPAERRDCEAIVGFIKDLAKYEKMDGQVVGTPELMEKWMFDDPVAEVLIPEVDGKAVGYAITFKNFSTFLTKPGLYLEDLYIDPEYRGQGIGTAILRQLANIVEERDYGRLEWVCLEWNQPSIDLYESLGAVAQPEWNIFRLTGDALTNFASGK
jgi:GNAT superfamily N-acetyltransferase